MNSTTSNTFQWNLTHRDNEPYAQQVFVKKIEKIKEENNTNLIKECSDSFFDFYYFIDGNTKIFINNINFSAKKDDFLVIPPDVHYTMVTSSSIGFQFKIHQNLLLSLMPYSPTQKQFRNLILSNIGTDNSAQLVNLNFFCNELYQETLKIEDYKIHAIESLISLILVNLLRHGWVEPLSQKVCSQEHKIFNHFLRLIEIHYTNHWTLPHYAKEIGITETRLNDICRRVAKTSSKPLVFERLIREAKQCLIQPQISIQELSKNLGFKDASYFSRFFYKNTGIRPSEYRNNH